MKGGQQLLTLVDYFGGGFAIFTLTIIEVVAMSWIYGMNRFIRDVKFMLGIKLGVYWKFCWGFFTPIALMGILAYSLWTFQPVEYSGFLLPENAMCKEVVCKHIH